MPRRKVFRDSDDDLESESEVSDVNEEEEEREEEEQLMAESDSDSDAPPEDIGFSHSKETALKKVTDALNSIKQQKEKLKDKRKKRDDTYKEQKKQKLEALEKTRLPEDFLAKIKSAPIVAEDPEENKEVPSERRDDEFLEDGSDFEEEKEGEDESEDGFISLGTSQVKAVCVEDHIKSSLTSAERAAQFRKNNLYGKRIHRESPKTRQNKLLKKAARY